MVMVLLFYIFPDKNGIIGSIFSDQRFHHHLRKLEISYYFCVYCSHQGKVIPVRAVPNDLQDGRAAEIAPGQAHGRAQLCVPPVPQDLPVLLQPVRAPSGRAR